MDMGCYMFFRVLAQVQTVVEFFALILLIICMIKYLKSK